MRLLDRILSEGFVSLKPNLDIARTRAKLETSQLVVIDNVATYHFQDLQIKLKEGDQIKASDFPNVMLPFETTFLEMRVRNNPSFEATMEECGVLAQMYKPESIDLGRMEELQGPLSDRAKAIFHHPDVKYLMMLLFFVYTRRVGKPHFAATFTLPVNADGQIIPVGASFPAIGMVYTTTGVADNEETKENLLFYLLETYIHPCLLALSFMHCRNVKVIEGVPPEKLSKKFRKRTGKPLLRYRLLQIDHMREILEREGGASTQGLKRALHICRGHFKTYGKDGKGLLFGKHVATVWVAMHTRGSSDEGIVVKDYEVVN